MCEKSWNKVQPQHTIRIIYYKLDIDSGSSIFESVIDRINSSDICIFNLTEKNHNVLFELGHAHGRGKELIWICNENEPLNNLPSDFQGRFILQYQDGGDLSDRLESELYKRIEALTHQDAGLVAFSNLWSLDDAGTADLVFGRIPNDEVGEYAGTSNPNYLRYQSVADIDTLIFLKEMLVRKFPAVAFCDHTADMFRKEIDNPTLSRWWPRLEYGSREVLSV